METDEKVENKTEGVDGSKTLGPTASFASFIKVECKVLKPVLDAAEKQFKFCSEECPESEKCGNKLMAFQEAMEFGKKMEKKEQGFDIERMAMLAEIENGQNRRLGPGEMLVLKKDPNGFVTCILNTGKKIKISRVESD
jgi:hypothetical protein